MALANFLGKAALSASQILQGFDYSSFQKVLLAHRIRICFDRNSISTSEGYATVDLLVRLFARLYPNLQIECINGESAYIKTIESIAISINPEIELNKNLAPTVSVIVGSSAVNFDCLKLYIGSDRWLSKFSLKDPQGSQNSNNRFGAGAAACFAAANVFRFVFKEQLAFSSLDNDFVFSTFDYSIKEDAKQGPQIAPVSLNDTILVGLGAIGNGTIWGLKGLELLGSFHFVDDQPIDLSNLQRYILTSQDDLEKPKVDIAENFLSQSIVSPFSCKYEEYIEQRGNWNLYRVAVCVDSAKDRRAVQGTLPKRIINGWTQAEQVGVSRHYNFLTDACLNCLYFPKKEQKSLPMEIAENFGLQGEQVKTVREYMATKKPVDDLLIEMICSAKKITTEELLPYKGKQIEIFHAEVICGGVMMRLTGSSSNTKATAVPSAFESALAGILLASEIVIDSSNPREANPPTITKINLIRPLTKYTTEMVEKHHSSKCICHDEVFRKRYGKKWSL